jgi:hypothetical protein
MLARQGDTLTLLSRDSVMEGQHEVIYLEPGVLGLPGIYRVLAQMRVRVRVSDPPQSGIQVGYGYRPRSDVTVPGTYPDPLCTLLFGTDLNDRAG